MKTPLFGPGGNSLSFFADGNKSTLQAPAWLRSRGLDCYEYQCGNGVTASEATLAAVGREAEKHGIALSLHAPYYISLSGVSPETREKSVSYIKQSVDAAEALGAYLIDIHAGSAGKIPREEAMALAGETLSHALDATDGSRVRLGIETMGKQNQLGTLDEVLRLCSADRRLYPVVDFGHLNARGLGGVYRTQDDYLRVFDAVDKALGADKAETLHCHFSKIEFTAGGEKRHLTFDDTEFGPDFEPLCEAIAKAGLAPRIICESAGTMAEDALKMKEAYNAALTRAQ